MAETQTNPAAPAPVPTPAPAAPQPVPAQPAPREIAKRTPRAPGERVGDLIPWVSVVRIDGEVHVLKHMSVRDPKKTLANVRLVHPDLTNDDNILSLGPADPKDPIGHIRRVADEVRSMPDYNELTHDRLAASRRQASERIAAEQAGAPLPEPEADDDTEPHQEA